MPSTTDPSLRSFVPVTAESHFPIQNLPFGVFRRRPGEGASIGVAIGDQVLDVTALEMLGLLTVPDVGPERIFAHGRLNEFFALGQTAWSRVRRRISQLLRADEPLLRDSASLQQEVLLPQSAVEMLLPCEIGDYTDFYSSREHATNVGTMLRGADNALQPNWLHLPVAYHGRASSVVISGTEIVRPLGQTRPDPNAGPLFGPSRALDFELEVGALVGPGNALGQPIAVGAALEHVFGLVLVNDWSARDIQAWEYQPLGPFLSKNFATSISPWVVPLEALAPFRVAGPPQDPPPLPYLQWDAPAAFDIHLEVRLCGMTIARSNFKHLYWSLAQQVAHHTVNGCNLRPGDLLASGTISGPTPDSRGCLLELTWRGTKPLTLPDGTQRRFLDDGDEVSMTGYCQGAGYRVGFGEVVGKVRGQ
jgi:fumarylacetoacetase